MSMHTVVCPRRPVRCDRACRRHSRRSRSAARAARPRSSGWSRPAASRPGSCMSPRCRWSPWISPSRRRRQPGPGRQAGRRPHLAVDCSTKAPANSTPRRSRQRIEDKAIELSFAPARDYIRGSMRTLKDNQERSVRPAAAGAQQAALRQPTRSSACASRSCRSCSARPPSPNDIANRIWWATAFPDHPYGRPISGTLESVRTITDRRSQDLYQARARPRHAQDRRSSATSIATSAGRADRPHLRRVAGEGRTGADPRCDDDGTGPPHRGRARRAAGGGDASAARASCATTRISSRPISSITSSAAARSPRGSITRCARSAASPTASPAA